MGTGKFGSDGESLVASIAQKTIANRNKDKAKKPAKRGALGQRGTDSFLKNVAASSGVSKQTGTKSNASRSSASASGRAAAKRTIPLGQQQKYIFDLARSQRVTHTFAKVQEVLAKENKEVNFSSDLIALLNKNERLCIDPIAQTLIYKPKYTISSKSQLHTLIRRHPQGLICGELLDAYPSAREHLNELLSEQQIFECGSRELNDTVIYPNDLVVPDPPEEQLRNMVCNVTLPPAEDIDEELHAAGIIKAKRSTARLKMAVITDKQKGPKEKAAPKIKKMTNAHMTRELLGRGGGIDG